MPGSIKLTDLERFARFAQVIRQASSRIARLRVQDALLGQSPRKISPALTQISNAIRALASAHTIVVNCHCTCGSPMKSVTSPRWLGNAYHQWLKTPELFEPSLVVTGLVNILPVAKGWLSRGHGAALAEGSGTALNLVKPAASWGGSVVARTAEYLRTAEVMRRALALAADAVATLTLREWDLGALGALALGSGAYLADRFREKIRRAVSSAWQALNRIAKGFEKGIAAITEAVRRVSNTLPRLLIEPVQRRAIVEARAGAIAVHLSALGAATRLMPRGTSLRRTTLATQSISRNDGRLAMQLQPGTFRHSVIAAALAAPMLSAPTMAAVPTCQREAEPAYSNSLVINSSPSITIKVSDASEIERRVLDALRQHREALYDQWHREVRRRQRVEF